MRKRFPRIRCRLRAGGAKLPVPLTQIDAVNVIARPPGSPHDREDICVT